MSWESDWFDRVVQEAIRQARATQPPPRPTNPFLRTETGHRRWVHQPDHVWVPENPQNPFSIYRCAVHQTCWRRGKTMPMEAA